MIKDRPKTLSDEIARDRYVPRAAERALAAFISVEIGRDVELRLTAGQPGPRLGTDAPVAARETANRPGLPHRREEVVGPDRVPFVGAAFDLQPDLIEDKDTTVVDDLERRDIAGEVAMHEPVVPTGLDHP